MAFQTYYTHALPVASLRSMDFNFRARVPLSCTVLNSLLLNFVGSTIIGLMLSSCMQAILSQNEVTVNST